MTNYPFTDGYTQEMYISVTDALAAKQISRWHYTNSTKREFNVERKAESGLLNVTSRWNYSVNQKIPPPRGVLTFFIFFTNGWEFLINFLHTYYRFSSTHWLQIFIQLSPISTKLRHIKRDYPVHIICSECSQSAKTHALTRLRKSLIALLIVVCGK